MKLWERSFSQALGQVDAARMALVSVGGHIMPDELRAKLREAQRLLDEVEVAMHNIVREHEDTCTGPVPWERANLQ